MRNNINSYKQGLNLLALVFIVLVFIVAPTIHLLFDWPKEDVVEIK